MYLRLYILHALTGDDSFLECAAPASLDYIGDGMDKCVFVVAAVVWISGLGREETRMMSSPMNIFYKISIPC